MVTGMNTSRQVSSLIIRQSGVLSYDQAQRAGMTARQIESRVRRRDWIRVHPGVYRHGVVAPNPEGAARAAALWLGPDAALTGHTAAWWWGFTTILPTQWELVTANPTHLPRAPDVRISRQFVDPFDRCQHRGLNVISKPLALLRGAVVLESSCSGMGIGMIDRAKQQRIVSGAELELAFRRHRGTWGTRAMRRLLDRTGDRAHSELERLGVRLLRDVGITGFEVNKTLRLSNGRLVEADILFRRKKVIIELDGFAYHSAPEAHQYDLKRQNELMDDGWTVRRFSYRDLIEDPAYFARTVLELIS